MWILLPSARAHIQRTDMSGFNLLTQLSPRKRLFHQMWINYFKKHRIDAHKQAYSTRTHTNTPKMSFWMRHWQEKPSHKYRAAENRHTVQINLQVDVSLCCHSWLVYKEAYCAASRLIDWQQTASECLFRGVRWCYNRCTSLKGQEIISVLPCPNKSWLYYI